MPVTRRTIYCSYIYILNSCSNEFDLWPNYTQLISKRFFYRTCEGPKENYQLLSTAGTFAFIPHKKRVPNSTITHSIWYGSVFAFIPTISGAAEKSLVVIHRNLDHLKVKSLRLN